MEQNNSDNSERPPRPTAPFDATHIPDVLRVLTQWVCWHYVWNGRKWTKVPVDPKTGEKAAVDDPSTWSSFDCVLAALQSSQGAFDGIGFVFTGSDPFCGIDLDGCRDGHGNIVVDAQSIIDDFATYTEGSPSGEGVKLILIGKKPAGAGCRKKMKPAFREIEVYDHGRFFTLTGLVLPSTPTSIEDGQTQLDAICTRLWPAKSRAARPANVTPVNLGDDALLKKAFGASNGAAIERLWNGDISGHGNDHSAADLALCGHLRFWCGEDTTQMDRLFRQSGLMRDKWNERHCSDGRTYGKMTIDKALEGPGATYSGNGTPKQPAGDETSSGDAEGPFGVSVTLARFTQAPTRKQLTFDISIDGVLCDEDWSATDTPTGIRTATSELVRIVRQSKPDSGLPDEAVERLEAWARKTLSRRSIDELARAYQRRQPKLQPQPAEGPSVFDISLRYARETYQLSFVDSKGRIWSESMGRIVDRNEFVSLIDASLRKAMEAGHDFAEPTDTDPTKPLRHAQWELRVVWSELLRTLPDEVHAHELGPTSKAAAAVRDKLLRMWQVPETWIKSDGKRDASQHVERMSLASRVRVFASEASRTTSWARVLKGVDAYYRVEMDEHSVQHVWLAMRWPLCRDQIKAVSIDCVRSQEDLTTLMHRYGLADTDSITDRLREDDHRVRVCVLSRQLCDLLIDSAEGPEEGPGPDPTSADGPAQSRPRINRDIDEDDVDAR